MGRCAPRSSDSPVVVASAFGVRSHHDHQSLEQQEQQDTGEQVDRELHDLDDEPQIAAVPREQVQEPGRDDRPNRQEQEEPDENQDVGGAPTQLARGARRYAGLSVQSWKAEGTVFSSANVTISYASARASSARANWLFSAWPDL